MVQTEIVSLAPAAGSGIGKQLADELLKRPDFVKKMADAMEDALEATLPRRWDASAKDWAPADPDCKVRINAVALLLAHMEGEPIKRIIHQHLGGNGMIDPLSAMKESPALRDAAKRLIEKAEWHERPGGKSGAQLRAERAAEATVEVD